HCGHLVLAEAAASRYALRQVLFVAANVPPHKQKTPPPAVLHPYAMVAPADRGERRFVPSLLEAREWATAELRSAGQPGAHASGFSSAGRPRAAVPTWVVPTSGGANYSIDTVRRGKEKP